MTAARAVYTQAEARSITRSRSAGRTRRAPAPAITHAASSTAATAMGRPVGVAAEAYEGRNVVERAFDQLQQWRVLATRYDEHAVVHRAGLVLGSIVLWLRTKGDTPQVRRRAAGDVRPAH